MTNNQYTSNIRAKITLESRAGRLGDLGTIADKYDVAVSTACGALNNVVVENTAVAQRCCDHLRYVVIRANSMSSQKSRRSPVLETHQSFGSSIQNAQFTGVPVGAVAQ